MASSAYQLWLKKREFKAPRPPSPSSASSSSFAAPPSTESASDAAKLQQVRRVPSTTKSGPSGAVSAVERTSVAVNHIARPSAVGKRPRSWLSSREEAEGLQDGAKVAARKKDTKVAGCSDKVVARLEAQRKRPWSWNDSDEAAETATKRRRSGREQVMKETALKLAGASKVLRQSAAKREQERAVWSGRVEADAKVAAKVTAEVKSTGVVGLPKGTEVVLKRKRAMQEQSGGSGDTTIKRLRFDVDEQESDEGARAGGLPPKSPVQQKRRKMRAAMLDESQYWMAVDRFSHLS
ncbi:uncharacterized protein IUM83_17038 [Phytophthora cinnamomi]|uniref:uncharacterized protein n=1 Tax=Phytophthora cinnamomi TaxID=4785 RepID=UPI00355A0189|nr:hypothetical protein IUM83_17038 [Phytophthora cinnamomi]